MTRHSFKGAAKRTAYRAMSTRLARIAAPQECLAVLAYHRVGDKNRFDDHLRIVRACRTPVSEQEVIRWATGSAPLPPRPVLITFDDGHRSVLERAAPALIDRGIPALVFVVAGHLDTDTPFWWDQVAEAVAHGARAASIDLPRSPQAAVRHLKSVPDAQRRYVVNELARQHPLREMNLTAREVQQMHVAGIGIGSHSYTHPILDMCTSDTIAHEVEQSRTLLTDVLGGTAPSCFAYPNGDRDQRVRLAVERANYEVAFTFDHRLQPLDPPSAPLEISRVRVDADDDPARLRAVLSGVEPLLLHRLGRVSDRSSSRRD